MAREGRTSRGRIIGISAAMVAGLAAATAAGIFGYRTVRTRRLAHHELEPELEKLAEETAV